MNQFIQNVLGASIVALVDVSIASKLLNNKVNYKNLKTWIILFFIGLFTVINYFYNNQFLRIVATTIFLSIFLNFLFKEKIKRTILSVITIQLLFMTAEVIFAFGLMYILKVNPENFVDFYFGKFLTNFIISTTAMILSKFKLVIKFYNLSLKITDKIKTKLLVILLILLMLIANIYAGITYYNFNFVYIMIFNISLTCMFFIIIFNALKTKNNYLKVYDKYNTTLNSLKEYEDILDKYRILNHENKNQLLTIRNMVSKSEKDVISYIDQIVENKLKDNEKIMLEVSKIPTGGLRGLIYSKILLMKNLKINYELSISKEIKTFDLIDTDDALMLDVCKIIGVYIDNSIQAIEKLKKKYLLIELFLQDGYLVIKITNNYKGTIEIEKLEMKGYTTKEDGHGYGLSLAKQIIDNNSNLSNEKRISKNLFTQILKIKM